MPMKAARPCPGRGKRRGSCRNLIHSERLCPECQAIDDVANARYDRDRDQTEERRFIHSTAWRNERDEYLSEHPLCERCQRAGHDRAAMLVHHRDHNELNRAEENKEALCNACHEDEHRKERWRR